MELQPVDTLSRFTAVIKRWPNCTALKDKDANETNGATSPHVEADFWVSPIAFQLEGRLSGPPVLTCALCRRWKVPSEDERWTPSSKSGAQPLEEDSQVPRAL